MVYMLVVHLLIGDIVFFELQVPTESMPECIRAATEMKPKVSELIKKDSEKVIWKCVKEAAI